jgi:hypothetical protein
VGRVKGVSDAGDVRRAVALRVENDTIKALILYLYK